MGKKVTRTIQTIICGICIWCGITAIAYAQDTVPDTLTIESSAIATNLADTGDYLFICQYDCSWALEANYPDDPISEKLVVQLLNQSGSIVYATTSPYPYYNNGYDNGIASIYLNPVAAAAYGIKWEGQYILRIITNPGAFTTISYEYILPSNEYCTSGTTSRAANRNWVADYCRNTAKTLEVNWGIAYALTTQSINEVLSEYGEQYYGRAIPGLKTLCPDLYLVTENVSPFTEHVYGGTHATALQDQWSGQDNLVTDGMESAGNLIGGGDSVFAMNMLSMGVVLALLLVTGAAFKAMGPGMLGGAVFMMIFMDLGWLVVLLLGIIWFLYAAYAVNKTIRINQA